MKRINSSLISDSSIKYKVSISYIFIILIFSSLFFGIKIDLDFLTIGLYDVLILLFAFYLSFSLRIKLALKVLKTNFYFFLLVLFLTISNVFVLNNLSNSIIPLLRWYEAFILLICVQYCIEIGFVKLDDMLSLFFIGALIFTLLSLITTLENEALGGTSGFVLIPGLLLGMFFNGRYWKISKLINLILSLIFVVVVFFVSKRTYLMLGLVLIMFQYMIVIFKIKSLLKGLILLTLFFFLFSIVVIPLLSIVLPDISEKELNRSSLEIFYRLSEGEFKVTSVASRLTKWGAFAFQITSSLKTFVFGVGFGNIDCGLPWLGIGNKNPDNQFIRILGHGGFISLFLFIKYLKLSYINIYKNINNPKLILFWFIIFSGLFWSFSIGLTLIYFAFYFGYLNACNINNYFIDDEN